MSSLKQQQIGVIYKIGAFLAFIMLGYLGLRGYKNSTEKLKINGCIEEVGAIMSATQKAYARQHNYYPLDYKQAISLNIIPRKMFRPGFTEAVNSYLGGIDLFYSSGNVENDNKAFEISFQGLSSMGCKALMRIHWTEGEQGDFIAVGGYSTPTPSGVLDDVLQGTQQNKIKKRNVYVASEVRYLSDDKVNAACGCKEDNCTVVWKFK